MWLTGFVKILLVSWVTAAQKYSNGIICLCGGVENDDDDDDDDDDCMCSAGMSSQLLSVAVNSRLQHVCVGRSTCLLYTSPSPRDRQKSRMPSSA